MTAHTRMQCSLSCNAPTRYPPQHSFFVLTEGTDPHRLVARTPAQRSLNLEYLAGTLYAISHTLPSRTEIKTHLQTQPCWVCTMLQSHHPLLPCALPSQWCTAPAVVLSCPDCM